MTLRTGSKTFLELPGDEKPKQRAILVRRKMAAILAADVVGFSRLIAEDEEETLRRLSTYRNVFDDFVARYQGRIFNTAGDSVMCEFESAVEATRAAIDIQESLRTHNLAYAPGRWLQFRIGISVGDVVERNGDLLGIAVNIAARLEKLAAPGGICISHAVHGAAACKLSVPFVDLGERRVKNIPTPIHAFAIAWPGSDTPVEQRGALAFHRRSVLWLAGAGTALAMAGFVLGHQGVPPFGSAAMDRTLDSIDAPMPAQQAVKGLALPADPAEAFARHTQKGGQIDDPLSAPGLYHNALLFEAKGEALGAHRAYYALARMGLDFIDPHLRYAALVRTHEGKATARQVYAELNEDTPTLATQLVHALQFSGADRLARITTLVAEHPDFAPAQYFLAEEHSEERLGSAQTLQNRMIEFDALTEFLKAEQEGRLASFFLDHSVAADWLERARKRHETLKALLTSASVIPTASAE